MVRHFEDIPIVQYFFNKILNLPQMQGTIKKLNFTVLYSKQLGCVYQVVINGLYSSENNVQANFDTPIKVNKLFSVQMKSFMLF